MAACNINKGLLPNYCLLISFATVIAVRLYAALDTSPLSDRWVVFASSKSHGMEHNLFCLGGCVYVVVDALVLNFPLSFQWWKIHVFQFIVKTLSMQTIVPFLYRVIFSPRITIKIVLLGFL